MRHCDQLPLLTKAEAAKIKASIEEYIEAHPHVGLAEHEHLPYLLNGVSVHHAGMLPSWKALIENLFQKGLIKVVFATETLAAGINMPARTTIISSLSKRTDDGHRQLKASEFLQMSGRAGRRGMDDLGHVVVLHHPFESADDAARLAIAPADPLVSRFSPSYGMVLNLLETHTLEQAKDLIEASFGQYLVTQNLTPYYEDRMRLEQKLAQMQKAPGRQEKQIVKTAERLKFLERHIQRESNKYWQSFEALAGILSLSGYLDANRPTKLGHLAQGIRSNNEFFLSEVCISGLLENLNADELAAILTALVTEDNRYEDRMRNSFKISNPQMDYTLASLGKVARRVNKLQRDFSVDIPVQFSSVFCQLTQAWAQGASWEDISSNSKIDEGDIVRVLRRTLDICRQIQRAPSMNEKLVNLCMQAEQLIARDEIKEAI
jgi:superfamily II RNA helicase